VFKTSRNDGASEDPRLEEHGKKYKHSFYRMLGDVSLFTRPFFTCVSSSSKDHGPMEDG